MFTPQLFGGGGAGKVLRKSETILVGTDVDSLTEAFEYLDKYAHAKGARFTIELPSSGTNYFHEALKFIDVDYSAVTIRGALPAVAISTSAVVSGTVPNLSVTFNFAADTLTTDLISTAVAAGCAVVHDGSDPGTVADGALAGVWPVTASTATSLTLAVKVRGTLSATTNSGVFVVNAMRSMFRPKAVDGVLQPLLTASNSIAPRLQWVGFDGQRYVNGAPPQAFIGVNSSFRLGDIDDTSSLEPGIAITGASNGASVVFGSHVIGSIMASDCVSIGLSIGADCSFSSRRAVFTGNGSHGLMVGQNAKALMSPYNGGYMSIASGNGGSGVMAHEQAIFHSISFHCSANAAAAQLLAQNNGQMIIGGTTQSQITGSVSPSFNVAGNSNSYIKRY